MLTFSTCSVPSNILYSNFSMFLDNSNTVNFSGKGTKNSPIKAHVNVSSDVGNILTIRQNGLYVPNTFQFILSILDSPSIDFSGTGIPSDPLTGTVLISANPTNTLILNTDGLFVPPATVLISPDAGNIIEQRGNGLYATAGGGEGCPVCADLVVEGFNNAFGFPPSITVNLTYQVAYTPGGSYIVDGFVNSGDQATFVKWGSTPNTALSIEGFAFDFDNPVPESLSGKGIAGVITLNDEIFYAASITDLSAGSGLYSFPSIPITTPKGVLRFYINAISQDTNDNDGLGFVGVGGEKFANSSFNVTLNMIGGGVGGSVIWPDDADVDNSFLEIVYDTKDYGGPTATSANLSVSGINNEVFDIEINVIASIDSILNTTQVITPGNSAAINIPLTLAQVTDNDFVVQIRRA